MKQHCRRYDVAPGPARGGGPGEDDDEEEEPWQVRRAR